MSNKSEKTPTAYFLWVCKCVCKSALESRAQIKALERDSPIACSLGRGLKLGCSVLQEYISLTCMLFSLE